MKALIKISAITIISFIICGCMSSIANKQVTKQQYLLHLTNPNKSFPELSSSKIAPTTKVTNATKKTRANYSILIAPIDIAAPFDQQNFIYRVSTNQYLVDYYNSFMLAPARQLDSLLVNYLQTTKKFKSIVLQKEQQSFNTATNTSANNAIDATSKMTKKIILKIKILELYADYRDRNHPQAVVTLRINLIKQLAQRGKKVQNTTKPETAAQIMHRTHEKNDAALLSASSLTYNQSSKSADIKQSLLIDKTLQVAIPLKVKNTDNLLTAWEECFKVLFGQIAKLI